MDRYSDHLDTRSAQHVSPRSHGSAEPDQCVLVVRGASTDCDLLVLDYARMATYRIGPDSVREPDGIFQPSLCVFAWHDWSWILAFW